MQHFDIEKNNLSTEKNSYTNSYTLVSTRRLLLLDECIFSSLLLRFLIACCIVNWYTRNFAILILFCLEFFVSIHPIPLIKSCRLF